MRPHRFLDIVKAIVAAEAATGDGIMCRARYRRKPPDVNGAASHASVVARRVHFTTRASVKIAAISRKYATAKHEALSLGLAMRHDVGDALGMGRLLIARPWRNEQEMVSGAPMK